jgi:hypothetical protein
VLEALLLVLEAQQVLQRLAVVALRLILLRSWGRR